MAASITKTETIKHYVPLNETHKITFEIVFRKKEPKSNQASRCTQSFIGNVEDRIMCLATSREGNEQNPGKQSAFFKQNNCKEKKKRCKKKVIYEIIKLKTKWIFYIMELLLFDLIIFYYEYIYIWYNNTYVCHIVCYIHTYM